MRHILPNIVGPIIVKMSLDMGFAILTVAANPTITPYHDRMPVIIPSDSYNRWLANIEPDPRDLLVPYPSGLMRMWPISTRINKPSNDDPAILDPLPPS